MSADAGAGSPFTGPPLVGTPPRLVVVGGGVLGTMHAVTACRLGWRVTQLERERKPRGASVRNFGLVWVSGRAPGAELALACRARELWDDVAAWAPGLSVRSTGSLTVARDESELAVLEQAARLPDAATRQFELLEPALARKVNPALRGTMAGALWCRADAVVEPRRVLGALRRQLLATGRYTWLPGRQVVDVADGAVRDDRGEWHRGDLVALCTGATHTGPAAPALGAGSVRRVRLQMFETEPLAEELPTALADGDSLRYYPAYDLPGRAALAPQAPVATASKAQLLVVQRADGTLTVGDTHDDDEPFPFDLDEAPYEHLRDRAAELLGRPLPPTRRRWAGVYSQTTGPDLYCRVAVAPDVVLVTGAGGRGMTCAPAIAEETFS